MTRILLLSFFLIFFSRIQAQDECLASPSLEELITYDKALDYIRDHNSIQNRSKNVAFVQIYHIFDSNSGSKLSPTEINTGLNILNDHFKNSDVRFELCESVINIDNPNYKILYITENLEELMNEHFNEDVINIYLAPSVVRGIIPICGTASFPDESNSKRRLVVSHSCFNNTSTFAHEMGHYYGLLHTHTRLNGEELVNRSNCQHAGDKLCDTAADPKLSSSIVKENCLYIGNERDQNNDLYLPDPHNLMSYSRKHCRDTMTPQQIEVINYFNKNENYKYTLHCNHFDLALKSFSIDHESHDPYFPLDTIKAVCYLEKFGELDEGEMAIQFTLSNPNSGNIKIFEKELQYNDFSVYRTFNIVVPRHLDIGDYEIHAILTTRNSDPEEANLTNNDLDNQISISHNHKSKNYISYFAMTSQLLVSAPSITKSEIDVKIFNSSGQLIIEITDPVYFNNYYNYIDLPQLSSGVYICKVGNDQLIKFIVP